MTDIVTIDEYRRLTKQHKYHAQREEVDGILFDSKKEAQRYRELKILERQGYITHLILQPRFPIVVAAVHICEYCADFSYFDVSSNTRVVEDCKGMKTPVYRLKKKLFEALYGMKILET